MLYLNYTKCTLIKFNVFKFNLNVLLLDKCYLLAVGLLGCLSDNFGGVGQKSLGTMLYTSVRQTV